MYGMRTEQHQHYMDFAPLLLYLVTMILRQSRCHALCTSETVTEVNKLLNELPKMEFYDCKLYTPTLNDYMNCSKSTMGCFQKETTVLIAEIRLKDKKTVFPRMLGNLARKDKKPPCPACEIYKEEKAEKFLKTLGTILESMNSLNGCST